MQAISCTADARHAAKIHCVPTRCTRLSTQAPAQIRPIGLRRPPSLLECSSLRSLAKVFAVWLALNSLCLYTLIVQFAHTIMAMVPDLLYIFKIRVIKRLLFIHVFAGHKLINPYASKLASDHEAFDPGII